MEDLKLQILSALGLNKEEEVKFETQAKLTDGTIIVSSADALEAGVDVSILTEDGTTMPLPAGKYETEDGVGFSVEEEGIIAEIYEEEEAEEETEETEEIETEEEPETGGGLEDIAADMEGSEGDLMDHLISALKVSKGMDNDKLTTQIGNTLKFFVGEYIGGEE